MTSFLIKLAQAWTVMTERKWRLQENTNFFGSKDKQERRKIKQQFNGRVIRK